MFASDYILALIVAFAISVVFTLIVSMLAKRFRIVDVPDQARKIHHKPTPLLGGLAIFLSFNLAVFLYSYFTNDLIGDTISLRNLAGIFLGSLFLAIGGFLDDKYNLKPKWQIVWPILSVLSVIVCGLGIDWVTNPFGEGIFYLDGYVFNVFWYAGFPYKITLLADVFTLIWLMAMIYTTKLLDGLDGLVSGMTVISAIFIFLTSLNKGEIIQTDVALLSMILLGVFAGFLVFNFNPASIFLGEGGSTMAGFLLGSLSIISGSKVGVTLMLLSIPVLDFIWTIIRRLLDKRSPFSTADDLHLHFRLLRVGLSVKQAVFFLYSIAIVFGTAIYYLQDYGLGFWSFSALAMMVFMVIMAYIYRKKKLENRLLTEGK
jgi:UDP-GlcNAc:undecaprenyl-phosphate GlcNAc-1-phosphate transferase